MTEILVGFGGAMLNLGELNLRRRDFAVLVFAHFGDISSNLKFSRQICTARVNKNLKNSKFGPFANDLICKMTALKAVKFKAVNRLKIAKTVDLNLAEASKFNLPVRAQG